MNTTGNIQSCVCHVFVSATPHWLCVCVCVCVLSMSVQEIYQIILPVMNIFMMHSTWLSRFQVLDPGTMAALSSFMGLNMKRTRSLLDRFTLRRASSWLCVPGRTVFPACGGGRRRTAGLTSNVSIWYPQVQQQTDIIISESCVFCVWGY